MADPVSIGLLVTSLAISAFGAVQQQRMATASAEAQAQASAKNNEMAQAELTRQQEDANRAAQDQKSARIRQADKELALLQVAGADAGSGMQTMAQRVSELGFVEGQDLATMEANRNSEIQRLQSQKEASRQGVTNTIVQGRNEAHAATVGAGLQIGQAAVSTAFTGYQYGITPTQKPAPIEERTLKPRS